MVGHPKADRGFLSGAGSQYGGATTTASSQIEKDKCDALDHDQGADHGGEHSGRRLGAADEVVGPVPDDDEQDAAGPVVEPGQNKSSAGQPEEHADIFTGAEVSIRVDQEELRKVPGEPQRSKDQRRLQRAEPPLQLWEGIPSPPCLLPEAPTKVISKNTPTRPIAGVPLKSPKSASAGSLCPAASMKMSPRPRNASGLTATSHQRRPTRHRTIRRSRSRTPGRPALQAVTAKAAMAGPSSDG